MRLTFLFTSKCIVNLYLSPRILPHLGKDLSFLPPNTLMYMWLPLTTWDEGVKLSSSISAIPFCWAKFTKQYLKYKAMLPFHWYVIPFSIHFLFGRILPPFIMCITSTNGAIKFLLDLTMTWPLTNGFFKNQWPIRSALLLLQCAFRALFLASV